MSILNSNPIKINLMSIKKSRVLKKYVFIGVVPKDVQSELLNIQKTKKFKENNEILKKFYGINWSKIVGIDYLGKVGGSEVIVSDNVSEVGGDKLGGDEFDFDDDPSRKKIKEAQISEEELTNILNEIELEQESPIDIHTYDAFTQPVVNKIDESVDTELYFIFDDPHISIYSYDKVSELKKKIYVITKIPMYRQHLWFISKTASLPMSYILTHSSNTIPVNIQELSKKYTKEKLDPKIEQIENIPLNMDIYNIGDAMKIEAYDNFKILDEYLTKYDVSEFYVADILEFIDPANRNFTEHILKNKQQFNLVFYGFVTIYWPMITISAFKDFLKSESNIENYYPELYPNYEKVKEQYALEKDILDNSINLSYNKSMESQLKNISHNISHNITSATIQVSYVSNIKEKVIFSRNLLDKFELNDTINACRCITNYDDKTFIIDKTYRNSPLIKETMHTEGIIFRINPSDENLHAVTIIFHSNGNYIIKSTWRDEHHYGFDDIYKELKKLINPLIDKINNLAAFSLHEGKTISYISKFNAKFTEISMNIYYKQVFTESQFALLKFIIDEYKDAGIMDLKSVEKNYAEYYFRKGMYKFDPRRIEKISNIKNYYDYLSDGIIKQKWFTIFEKTRITKFWHRFSDIKIEIYGIREKEFNNFYEIILSLFYTFESRKKKNVDEYEFKKLAKKKVRRTLTDLKEQDPILYDFKKIYKSNTVYSRICQKAYQPLILNKTAYDKLPDDQRKNVVKYWNFTNETDAYYQCPNPKYPYVKFITKTHPKDYCIPCCKKMEISKEPKDPKRIIHEICLKDHEFSKEKKTITQGSKYIMTYGKDIEVGRLSKLPENTMEGIFAETFSMENTSDPSYMTSNGFYLYSTIQNTLSLHNVGYIYVLAFSLERPVVDIINLFSGKLREKNNIFNILLNGKITHYVEDSHTLADYIVKAFGNSQSDSFLPNEYMEIPWNKLFIDLAFNYLDLNTILFQHKKSTDQIDLRLPNGLDDVNDYILKDKKNIIILQKGDLYYPVYLLNTDLFFKLGIIEKKTFQSHDGVIKIIKGIVEKYLKSIQTKGRTHSKLNLIIIKAFLTDLNMNKKFEIHQLFINHSNFCYGIMIHNRKNKNYIYIPIEQSYYSYDISPNLEFKPYSRNTHKQTFMELMGFLNEFNKWVDTQSSSNINTNSDVYPIIKVDAWLVLQKSLDFQKTDKVIGFKSSNLYYYFTEMSHEDAIKLRKVKSIPLLYDPDVINAVINNKVNPKPDKCSENLAANLYKYNCYQLFLLEFLTTISKNTNKVLRNKLKKVFLGNFTKQIAKINNLLIEMIDDTEDLLKIKNQISDYINNHHDRKLLFSDIDNTKYKFDQILLLNLVNMDKDKLIQELKHITTKFIKIGDVNQIKNFKFPNIFASCQYDNKDDYCSDKKLIITKNNLDTYIDILANDILNPIKKKWIFSDIMTDRVINFLQFIKRSNEEIHITLLDP